jgi:hypothetical protein
MPQTKISLILFATLSAAAAASAQTFDIYNRAEASAYNPLIAEQHEHYTSWPIWGASGRDSNVAATSESHPWDPPINIATSMSHFEQPFFGDATVRAMSFVLSDYTPAEPVVYSASTFFELRQTLEVDLASVAPGFSIDFKLAVPMHGFIAAKGEPSGIAVADASLAVQALDGDGNFLDNASGNLHAESTAWDEFNYTATGDWAGDAQRALVDLPTGDQPRTSLGVELNSFQLLDLGVIRTGTRRSFEISYRFETSVSISSPMFLHALSDFSGTGAMTFLGFDESGNPFTDFDVYPVGSSQPVPEPTSLAAMGLGLAAITRRRRR